eukprot:scaffold2325_cov126-Cylindrotheca_fusiformis.AAC.6
MGRYNATGNLQGGGGSRCRSLSKIARGKCKDALFCRIIGIEIDQSIQRSTRFETSRPLQTLGLDQQSATIQILIEQG